MLQNNGFQTKFIRNIHILGNNCNITNNNNEDEENSNDDNRTQIVMRNILKIFISNINHSNIMKLDSILFHLINTSLSIISSMSILHVQNLYLKNHAT